MGVILADAWLITMNDRREVLDSASIYIEGQRIAAIGTRRQLCEAHPDAETIDCRGRIVMPGMVNTHTHLFQTLLKGLGDDMVLKKWFTCMTLPAACELTSDDSYIAALHGCVESLRSGVTTLVDFQYINSRPGMTENVVKAFHETGIRGFVCRGFLSAGQEFGVPEHLIEDSAAATAHARSLIRTHNTPDARVQVGLAPCMIWTVEAEGFRRVRQVASEEGALVTTHLAETDFEIQRAFSQYSCTDAELLSEIGFLGPDVLAVHCVQCNKHDLRVLRHHDVKVSHNPCSNLYLASGYPAIPEMLMAGITVGLASDGPASSNNHSLFQALKFAALVPKGLTRDATVITAEKVLEMATIDGARAVGLDREIGSVEVGKKADLIVIDYENAFMTPIHNPVSAIVYSALGHEVSDVMVDGAFVVRKGVVTSVDEKAVRERAQAAANSLAERSGIDRFKRRPWRSTAI
ncbi:amidohydrolase [Starkeya sp. ORNL1]|uniref:amidohydrolase family protein n=1 Tax=Starkeya sp. ORNL1 TaxID=2709380 RepID=UPI0014645BAA|nr:amidohydrolase [Starkeya sp. ORNL1]QJP12334.1 amidohydrolase [Starkeya sp. ORNL1]